MSPGELPPSLVSRTNSSGALALRQFPLIVPFQICVFIINPLFFKGKVFFFSFFCFGTKSHYLCLASGQNYTDGERLVILLIDV